jgi:hypothetical protein
MGDSRQDTRKHWPEKHCDVCGFDIPDTSGATCGCPDPANTITVNFIPDDSVVVGKEDVERCALFARVKFEDAGIPVPEWLERLTGQLLGQPEPQTEAARTAGEGDSDTSD